MRTEQSRLVRESLGMWHHPDVYPRRHAAPTLNGRPAAAGIPVTPQEDAAWRELEARTAVRPAA